MLIHVDEALTPLQASSTGAVPRDIIFCCVDCYGK